MAGQTASDSLPLSTPFHEEGGGNGGLLGQLMENSGCSNRFTALNQICTSSGPLYLNPALSSIFLSSTTSNTSDSLYEAPGMCSSLPPKKALVDYPPSPSADDAAQVAYVMEERCVPLEEMELEELSDEPRRDTLPASATEISPSAYREESKSRDPDDASVESNEHSIAEYESEAKENLNGEHVNMDTADLVDGDAESSSDDVSNSSSLEKSPLTSAEDAVLVEDNNESLMVEGQDEIEKNCSGPASSPQDLDSASESNANEIENDKDDELICENDTSEEAAPISDNEAIDSNGISLIVPELESERGSSLEQEEAPSMNRDETVGFSEDLEQSDKDESPEIEVVELADNEREVGQTTLCKLEQKVVDNRVTIMEDEQEKSGVEEIVIDSDSEAVNDSSREERSRPASVEVDVEDFTDRESCCSTKSDNSVLVSNSDDRSTGNTHPNADQPDKRKSDSKRNYNLRTRDNLDYNERQLGYVFLKPKKRYRRSSKSKNQAEVTTPDNSPSRYNSLKEGIRCSKLEIPIKKLPSPFASPKTMRTKTMRLVIRKTPSPTSKRPLVPSQMHTIPGDQITPLYQSPHLTAAVLSQSFSPYTVPGSTPVQRSNKSTQTPTTTRRSSSGSRSGQAAKDTSKPPSTPSKSRSPRKRRSSRLSDEQSGERPAKSTCVLCGLPSNFRSLGYLYGPYQCSLPGSTHEEQQDVRVHDRCTFWAPGVCLEGVDLRGLQAVVDECANQHCVVCNRPMATLSCHHHGCKAVYHYPCAQENNVQFVEGQFCIYCERHKKDEDDDEGARSTRHN